MLPRVTMPITDLERKENRNGMAYLLRLTPVLKGVDLVNIALTKKNERFMKPSVVNAGYLKEDRTKENDKTVYSLHCR